MPKNEGIDNTDKKKLSGQSFLSGHKAIYHQVQMPPHLLCPHLPCPRLLKESLPTSRSSLHKCCSATPLPAVSHQSSQYSPVSSPAAILTVTPSRPRPPGSSPPGYFPDTPRPIPVALAVAFQTFQAFQSFKPSKLSRLSKPPRLPKSIQAFQAF